MAGRSGGFCRKFDNNDLLSTSYWAFRLMRFKIWQDLKTLRQSRLNSEGGRAAGLPHPKHVPLLTLSVLLQVTGALGLASFLVPHRRRPAGPPARWQRA